MSNILKVDLPKEPLQSVVFDLDSTLVYSSDDIDEFDKEIIVKEISFRSYDDFEDINLYVGLRPGIYQLLSLLSESNVKVGIWSIGKPNYVDKIAKLLQNLLLLPFSPSSFSSQPYEKLKDGDEGEKLEEGEKLKDGDEGKEESKNKPLPSSPLLPLERSPLLPLPPCSKVDDEEDFSFEFCWSWTNCYREKYRVYKPLSKSPFKDLSACIVEDTPECCDDKDSSIIVSRFEGQKDNCLYELTSLFNSHIN